MRVIDFSARPIPPHLIKEAGYAGVVVYVSESRPGTNFGAKPVVREYADGLRAEGLEIVSNFQFGKPGGAVPSDFTRGFDGGVADATTALRLHGAAGGPDDAPIIFSVDDNVDLRTWNDVAVHWFRGINSVLGVERTGIYGHSRVCAWAIQDEVIGRSTTPGHHWIWQTRAWSQGEREPAAVLFQDVVDTQSNPGPLVGDIRVDVNEVLADDFGQWSRDRSAARLAAPPQFDEDTSIRSPYCGPRQADVLWFVLHTEDGASGSARNLARYLSNNDRKVSYHYTVDDEGHVFNIVDTDLLANSVFEPGNSRSINLCFASTDADWSRQTWLDRMQHGIDIAAHIAVRDARRYGLRPQVISRAEANRWESGITDHGAIVEATHVGDHTDVGSGFPWDYFIQKVNEAAGARARGRDIVVRSSSDYPGVTLVEGATGRHVTAIQQRLNVVTHAGLLVDGEFADRTRRAVTKFQRSVGLGADGEVDATTWRALFSEPSEVSRGSRGSTIVEDDEDVSHSFDVPDAAKAVRSRRGVGATVDVPQLDRRGRGVARGPAPYRMVTGPGITSSVQMELADLGIMRWDPERQAIAAMFGDNFSFSWGQDWKSPSIVMYDNDFNVRGIPTAGNGIAQNQNRQQLWKYAHSNGYFDTVLPCDFIKIGDWWHVAVMLSKGKLDVEGAQFVTEFWRSRDLVSWEWTGPKLEHWGGHPGNTMLTFDRIGDWVYIFGSGGLTRNKPVWMWRNRADQFPGGLWEPWGWDGFRWDWNIPNEATPILQGEYAELCFRYIDGNCVLSYLEGGRMTARTVQFPEDNWQDGAHFVDYVHDYEIQNLYGGYIAPGSHLNEDNGMKFFVSQWLDEWNYRVYLVEGTLFATGPVVRSVPPDLRARGVRDVPVVEDRDMFPLPDGYYWGPLDGPEESLSNRAGTEEQSSIDGLRRWQEAVGIAASGVYDDATKEAAAHMQYLLGWTPTLGSAQRGVIRVYEWDEVIRNGWRVPAPEQPTDPRTVASPDGYEIGWYPGPGYSEGHGPHLRIYLHTTENQDWITKAEDVAAGQAARQDGSYHFLVDDYHVINTVPTEHTAWGLQLDNPVSVQIAMTCTSGTIGCWQGRTNPNGESAPKTREQWLAHGKMLDMVAYTIAKVATAHGIPLEWLDIDGVGANRVGVSSHYNYSYGSKVLHADTLHGKQDTDHWDVPPTFPADVVLGAAKVYAATMAPTRAARGAPTARKAPAKKAAPVKKAAKKATPRKVAKRATPAKVAKKAAPRTQAKKGKRG